MSEGPNSPASLELAKRLKEEGYSKLCEFYWQDKDLPYSPKGLKKTKNGLLMNHNEYDEFVYSAPPTREAVDWLIGKKIEYPSSVIIKLTNPILSDSFIEKESLKHQEQYMSESYFEKGAKWLRDLLIGKQK